VAAFRGRSVHIIEDLSDLRCRRRIKHEIVRGHWRLEGRFARERRGPKAIADVCGERILAAVAIPQGKGIQ
jgi:hypothetical protein